MQTNTRTAAAIAEDIAAQRVVVAAAQARLATLVVEYADRRVADDERDAADRSRRIVATQPGETVPDELSLVLAEQPWDVRLLLARGRRVRAGLPEVLRAAAEGRLDAERVRLIDQAARLCTEDHTLALLDDEVVAAAKTRTPKQLKSWLDRFLATREPDAFDRRHRRAFADRRVTTSRSSTGMGYVTGEVSAADAADIDLRLSWLARGIGAADPRTEQQRRSDIFAAVLRGDAVETGGDAVETGGGGVEVEIVDPDTGEYLGTRCAPSASHPDPAAMPSAGCGDGPSTPPARIGVVVPLSSLLGLDDRPGELADRSGCLPADLVRDIAARPGSLFYRLLTDDRGRLLDVTELGRFPSDRLATAVRFRRGTCGFPTCTKPAELCDIDHHEPVPRGPTAGANLDPSCRHHHRGKTFAGLACRREDDAIIWTLPTAARYRCVDEPLPVGPHAESECWLSPPDDLDDRPFLDEADLDLAELYDLLEQRDGAFSTR